MHKINNNDLQTLCQLAIQAARSAGEIINTNLDTDCAVNVQHKAVGTSLASQVVTEVDHKAQAAILEILHPCSKNFNLALLAEESADDGLRQEKPAFWCIDPMDGTLAFINRIQGFSVSIALVAKNGKPLIGVVHDPVTQNLYYAIDEQGAYINEHAIHLPAFNPEKPLVLRTDPSFEKHPWFEQTHTGLQEMAQTLGLNGIEIEFNTGAVMNACNILQQPNACYFKYPRKENSGGSIWDYAATACLFHEAGAIATDISGMPLDLNRAGNTFLNHRGILYCGQRKLADEITVLYEKLSGMSL